MKKVTFESAVNVLRHVLSGEVPGIDLQRSYLSIESRPKFKEIVHVNFYSPDNHHIITIEAGKRSIEEGGCLFDGTAGYSLRDYTLEARAERITEDQYTRFRELVILAMSKTNEEDYKHFKRLGFEVVDLNAVEEI